MANARLGVSAARMGASSRSEPSVAIETKKHFISQMMAKRAQRKRARTDAEWQRACRSKTGRGLPVEDTTQKTATDGDDSMHAVHDSAHRLGPRQTGAQESKNRQVESAAVPLCMMDGEGESIKSGDNG